MTVSAFANTVSSSSRLRKSMFCGGGNTPIGAKLRPANCRNNNIIHTYIVALIIRKSVCMFTIWEPSSVPMNSERLIV